MTAATPVPTGDTIIANVDSLNSDGRGVAHIDGKATFIAGALPGERVRFRYHDKRPQFDTGAVAEVLTPSPNRVTPPCPHFGICGGCLLQHLAPPAQLVAKQRVLADAFRHIGDVEPETWLPPITGPAFGYRRRARLGARLVPKKGGVLVGFREHGRSFITPLATCLTLDPRASALLPALPRLIADLSQPNRLPQIEVAAGDNALALVFRHLEPLTEADRERLVQFGAACDVQIHLQPGGLETVHPLWPAEPAPLCYRIPEDDVTIEFRPIDFIQVNGEVNCALVQRAVTLLDVGPNERVLDLFCGLGNFTLPLARRARAVVGIEADAGLIERARGNALRNGLTNIEFISADLYTAPRAIEFGDGFDKLLLDPPRAGAMEVIKQLPAQGPLRIVYVSCHPATLARDAEYLVSVRGYKLRAAGVADMFPHTSHVESIALFERH